MKKKLFMMITVCTVLAMIASSCNEMQESANAAKQAAQSAEAAAKASQTAAQSAQQAVQALQSQSAQSPVEFIGPIAWNSDDWDPQLKAEVEALAKVTKFGDVAFAPEGEITAIIQALEINGIYSNAPTQTVVWYSYRTPEGKELNSESKPLTSKILIQGAWKQAEIEDLRTVLNLQRKCCNSKNSCSIVLGGCFSQVKCTEEVKSQCKPCQQGVGTGKKTADGIQSNVKSNGKDREIISIW